MRAESAQQCETRVKSMMETTVRHSIQINNSKPLPTSWDEKKNYSIAVERSMRMQNRRLSVSSSILAFPPPFCSKFRERRSLPLDKYTNARNWPARAVNACTVLEERGRTRDIKLSPNKSPWAPLLSVACFSLYRLPFVPSSSDKLGSLPPYLRPVRLSPLCIEAWRSGPP